MERICHIKMTRGIKNASCEGGNDGDYGGGKMAHKRQLACLR